MLVEDVRKIKGGAGLSVMMQEIDPRAGIGTKCSTMSQKAEQEQEQEQEMEVEVEVEVEEMHDNRGLEMGQGCR